MSVDRCVFALDFDGVVCDSADELYRTAFLAAKQVWPDTFADPAKWTTMPGWLVRCTREVRPVLETGFEGLLMVRTLVDAYEGCPADPMGAVAEEVTRLLEGWNAEAVAMEMRRLKVTKPQLVETFGRVREEWMATDLDGWLAATTFYPGTAEAIAAALERHTIFIITTKEQRFAQAILRSRNIHLPDANVYGLGMYRNKLEVLQDLVQRPEYEGCPLHFVEDRYPTLSAVKPHLEGKRVGLYLAAWGYNTPAVRRKAEADGGVRGIDLNGFKLLLTGRPIPQAAERSPPSPKASALG